MIKDTLAGSGTVPESLLITRLSPIIRRSLKHRSCHCSLDDHSPRSRRGTQERVAILIAAPRGRSLATLGPQLQRLLCPLLKLGITKLGLGLCQSVSGVKTEC